VLDSTDPRLTVEDSDPLVEDASFEVGGLDAEVTHRGNHSHGTAMTADPDCDMLACEGPSPHKKFETRRWRMIHEFNNANQTRWDKGGFQVMLKTPQSSTPLGFCDGEEADEREIVSMAEAESADVVIDKQRLKTGREIWTVRTTSERPDEF